MLYLKLYFILKYGYLCMVHVIGHLALIALCHYILFTNIMRYASCFKIVFTLTLINQMVSQ